MITKYTALLFIVIAASAGQIFLKKAVAPIQIRSQSLLDLAFAPYFWLGVFLYAACSMGWLWVLKSMPLSQAYPGLALTFVLVPLFSSLLLGETIGRTYWIGAFMIAVGVTITYINLKP